MQAPSNELRTRTLYNELSALSFSFRKQITLTSTLIFYIYIYDLYWENKTTPSNSVFRAFLAVRVTRGIPECYDVAVFLVLVHVILLTIFDNAWQNPVK